MIHIVDDVLSKREIRYFEKEIARIIKDEEGSGIDVLHQYDQIRFAHPILKVASRYHDLSQCCGYEIWQHDHTDGRLPWHLDKDEMLFALENRMRHPVCGIVYYLLIDENLKGGQLVFDNGSTVSPKKNRVVVFDSTLQHSVEEYTGRRYSVNINPWNEKYHPFS